MYESAFMGIKNPAIPNKVMLIKKEGISTLSINFTWSNKGTLLIVEAKRVLSDKGESLSPR